MKTMMSKRAFSLLELMVLVAVVAIFALTLLPALFNRNSHHRSPRIKCVNNLKNVGLSFRIYATDHNDHFPAVLLASNTVGFGSVKITQVFQSLSNELYNPKLLICPADKERKEAASFDRLTAKNISYFASLSANETLPQAILGGDRNLLVNSKPAPSPLALTTNTSVSWSNEIHNEQGNLVMADGSVQQFSTGRLLRIIRDQEQEQELATNYLIFP